MLTLSAKVSSGKSDQIFSKWHNFLQNFFFAKKYMLPTNPFTDKHLYRRNYFVSNCWITSLSINVFSNAFLLLKTNFEVNIPTKQRRNKENVDTYIWNWLCFSSVRKNRHEKNSERSFFCEGLFNPLEYFVCWLDSLCFTSFIKRD